MWLRTLPSQCKWKKCEERKVSCVHAKVGLNTVNPKKHRMETGQDRELLPLVGLNVV